MSKEKSNNDDTSSPKTSLRSISATKLSLLERQASILFQNADTDDNGSLTRDQLSNAIKSDLQMFLLLQSTSKYDIRKPLGLSALLEDLDPSRDDKISFDNFMESFRTCQVVSHQFETSLDGILFLNKDNHRIRNYGATNLLGSLHNLHIQKQHMDDSHAKAVQTLSLQLIKLAKEAFEQTSQQNGRYGVCLGSELSIALRSQSSFAALLLDTEVDHEIVLHLLDDEDMVLTLEEFLVPFERVKNLSFWKNSSIKINHSGVAEVPSLRKVRIPRATYELVENELQRFFDVAAKNNPSKLSRVELIAGIEKDEKFQTVLQLVNMSKDDFVSVFSSSEENSDAEYFTVESFRNTMERIAESSALDFDSLAVILNRRGLSVLQLKELVREARMAFDRASACVDRNFVAAESSANLNTVTIPLNKFCEFIAEDRIFQNAVHSVGISFFVVLNLLSKDASNAHKSQDTMHMGMIDFLSPFEEALQRAQSLTTVDNNMAKQCIADIATQNDPVEWYSVGLAALAVLGGNLSSLRPGLEVLDSEGDSALYLGKLAENDPRRTVQAPKAAKYKCVDPNGVAYRNSKEMSDRFEPEGTFASLDSIQEEVGEPTSDDWILVEVPGHGHKYLPLKKDDRVLFVKVEEGLSIEEQINDSFIVRIDRNAYPMFKSEAVNSGTLTLPTLEASMRNFFATMQPRTLRVLLNSISQTLNYVAPMSMQLTIPRENIDLKSKTNMSQEEKTEINGEKVNIAKYKFKCVDPNGVAYRNSKEMSDRFEPEGIFASLDSIQEEVGEPTSDDWILVEVPGHGHKYLPLKKDDRVLFVKVQDYPSMAALHLESFLWDLRTRCIQALQVILEVLGQAPLSSKLHILDNTECRALLLSLIPVATTTLISKDVPSGGMNGAAESRETSDDSESSKGDDLQNNPLTMEIFKSLKMNTKIILLQRYTSSNPEVAVGTVGAFCGIDSDGDACVKFPGRDSKCYFNDSRSMKPSYCALAPKDEVPTDLEIQDERVFEGPHPYNNNMRKTTKVHIPGAARLKVEWDGQCDTEGSYDYLQLKKKDGSGFWGPEKICGKYGFPTVIVNDDEFHIYFYSDGS